MPRSRSAACFRNDFVDEDETRVIGMKKGTENTRGSERPAAEAGSGASLFVRRVTILSRRAGKTINNRAAAGRVAASFAPALPRIVCR